MHPRYRHRGNRTSKDYEGKNTRKYDRHCNDSEDKEEDKNRHPKHLKGKDIGMWYARINREKRAQESMEDEATKKARKEQENSRTFRLGSIELADEKIENIMKQLEEGEADIDQLLVEDEKFRQFKTMFTKNITGNIYDKMQKTHCKLERNDLIDDQYFCELKEKEKKSRYRDMLEAREKLPSMNMRDRIIDIIEHNHVCVISGDTGCGKTTQVAQFILDHYINTRKGSTCKIWCTQPRRISAISVAERVAAERCERLGESVGYQIRLEKVMPRDTGSIVFCTTGIVLKRMETDPCLSDISHLILDEIHERDYMTDFIMAVIKKVLHYRSDLKIILMSATLNSEQFSKYFGHCVMCRIPGFTYPVKQYFLEDVVEKTFFKFKRYIKPRFNDTGDQELKSYQDYILPYVRDLEKSRKYSRSTIEQLKNPNCEALNMDLVVALITYICDNVFDNGAILVFVPGYAQIDTVYKSLQKSGKFPNYRYVIIPLHSQMPSMEQKQIFDRPPPGKRKIIISTTIAETSITIDDIVHVIDCGYIKYEHYDLENKRSTLNVHWESQANAQQRKGRAGRVQAGVCYHLFTKARYEILEKYLIPQILRSPLDNVVLQIKILQLGNAEDFLKCLIDVPDEDLISISVDLLRKINALDEHEVLTPLGYHLAKLPVSPQVGKLLLMGVTFGCLEPILSIAASLDFKDPFMLPMDKMRQADAARRKMGMGQNSDHWVLLQAIRGFEMSDRKNDYCWENFLSYSTLKMLVNLKQQFVNYLCDMDFLPDTDPKNPMCNMNSEDPALIKAVICAGLYPNLIIVNKVTRRRTQMRLLTSQYVQPHPKSVFYQASFPENAFIVYYKKLKSTADFFHDGTMVNKLPALFFSHIFEYKEEEETLYMAKNAWIKCSSQVAKLIMKLRERLNWFMEYKAARPGVVDWTNMQSESKLLRPILELIIAEDMGGISS